VDVEISEFERPRLGYDFQDSLYRTLEAVALVQKGLSRELAGTKVRQGAVSGSVMELHVLEDIQLLRANGLTRRECEVLYWIAKGKRDGEIATILFKSLRTVNHHVSSILKKLDAESRTMAVIRALELLKSC